MAAGYKQYETHTPNPYFVGFCGTSEAQCTADRFSSYYYFEMILFDYYLTLKLTGFSCRFFLTPGCETFRHYPLIFLIYNSGNDLTENNNNNFLFSYIQLGFFTYYTVVMGEINPSGPVPINSVFIYRPDKRGEIWRFLCYMVLHAG